MTTGSRPRCLLTGANGYLGAMISHKLVASGWEVIGLSRNPKVGQVAFNLGEPVVVETLKGYDALIHCAYDFSPIAWSDIKRINVDGSEHLLKAAKSAGIPNLLLISTISAFDGCKSNYGRAKLRIEKHAREVGACIVRPALIYGPQPGAMFGRLVSQIRTSAFVPIPGDGRQMMYTVHQSDLVDAVVTGLTTSPAPQAPITVGNETPVAFRDIMISIGRRLGKRVTPIPLPWRVMWLMIRAAEIMKIPLGLRSDSLVSMVNQDAAPVLNVGVLLGVSCRPFSLDEVPLTQ